MHRAVKEVEGILKINKLRRRVKPNCPTRNACLFLEFPTMRRLPNVKPS